MEHDYEDRDFLPEWEEDYEDPLEVWEDQCGYDPEFEGICHHVGSEIVVSSAPSTTSISSKRGNNG